MHTSFISEIKQDRRVLPAIDFYFDFISPYAYLASTMIESVAENCERSVNWLPFRLGVTVTKAMGLKPLMETPLKGEYLRRDIIRLAAVLGVPMVEDFTVVHPLAAQRVFHALPAGQAPQFAKAVLRARWADGADIAQPDILVRIAQSLDITGNTVLEALQDEGSKRAVREATDRAIARGVFGSPTCAVGDELFWGMDRLWLLSEYLRNGERYPKGVAQEFKIHPFFT